MAEYKFLQKLWGLNELILEKIKIKGNDNTNEKNLEIFINETIEKFNYNLEKFNYNVLIANLYETYNFLVKGRVISRSSFESLSASIMIISAGGAPSSSVVAAKETDDA